MARFAHKDVEKKSDAALAEEARQHLATDAALQLVAELLVRLRGLSPSFWTPEAMRARFPAHERMAWFAQRADVRQRITSQLTGLAPKAARKKAPEFQAALVDSVVDEGDVTSGDFEDAFDPVEVASYGPQEALWRTFTERFPRDAAESDAAIREAQELSTWLLEALLASTSGLDGAYARRPILRPIDVRAAIDGAVWHTRVPLEVRVAIDRARLAQERDRPTQPFGTEAELAIATPAVLAANLPMAALSAIWAAAGAALGFAPAAPAAAASAPGASAEPRRVEPAPKPLPSTLPKPSPSSMVSQPPLPLSGSLPPLPMSSPPPAIPVAASLPQFLASSVTRPSQAPSPLSREDSSAPRSVPSPASRSVGPPPLPTTPPGMQPAPPPLHSNGPPPLPQGDAGPASIGRGKGRGSIPPRTASADAFEEALSDANLDVESTNPWDVANPSTDGEGPPTEPPNPPPAAGRRGRR